MTDAGIIPRKRLASLQPTSRQQNFARQSSAKVRSPAQNLKVLVKKVMKPLSKIKFGFSDAENYKRREDKDLFNKIFLQDSTLEDLHSSAIFFLIGEKGTGKTAYATFYSNNQFYNDVGVHRYLRETDYLKFVKLKQANHLQLSDYTDIWKVIIYLLIAGKISENASITDLILRYPKFKALRAAIAEYYNGAFAPEIPTALQIMENTDYAAELMIKHSELSASAKASTHTSRKSENKTFQTNLLTIQRAFKEALSSLKLSQSHVVFIDGIDIRPSSITYDEYLDCVKGLANAVWDLNNDVFSPIKDSKGRFRAVLLVRPDIFSTLGLHNANTKLRDNSVVLDWRVNYYSYRNSGLFKLADRMFSAQQDEVLPVGSSWDHYFPFYASNVRTGDKDPSSFIELLRYTFHRPRDVLQALDVLAKMHDRSGVESVFTFYEVTSADFKRDYGDYLLGEVRDSLRFFYSDMEFETFLRFFEFLSGKQKFNYDEYIDAFSKFDEYLMSIRLTRPDFMDNSDDFLQFLFDQNIVGYVEESEDDRFIRWCFRERTPTRLAPKVKTGLNYEVHYGLSNSLNLGRALTRPGRGVFSNLDNREKSLVEARQNRSSKQGKSISSIQNKPPLVKQPVPSDTSKVGTVVRYSRRKKRGFILVDGREVYFHRRNFPAGAEVTVGQEVTLVVSSQDGQDCATQIGLVNKHHVEETGI